jgi:hypothetical protein
MRQDPIPILHHLASNRGISGLIGFPEISPPQIEKKYESSNYEKENKTFCFCFQELDFLLTPSLSNQHSRNQPTRIDNRICLHEELLLRGLFCLQETLCRPPSGISYKYGKAATSLTWGKHKEKNSNDHTDGIPLFVMPVVS